MAALVYPPSLPGPKTAPAQSAERRLLAPQPGPFAARAFQRDRRETETLAFPLFNADQATTFRDWFEDTLVQGGAWFAASWVTPQGAIPLVRRFVGEPHWEYAGKDLWRITATCELRGRGLLPQQEDGCYHERFFTLSDYETVSGSRSLFTTVTSPYGNALNCQSQNAVTVAEIVASIIPKTAVAFHFKFKLVTLAADDAATVVLQVAGVNVVALNPRREAVFDSLRRAVAVIGAESHTATSGSLTSGQWYQADFVIAPGFGNSSVTLTSIPDGTPAGAWTFTGNHTPPDIDAIGFVIDANGTTSTVQYADLEIC